MELMEIIEFLKEQQSYCDFDSEFYVACEVVIKNLEKQLDDFSKVYYEQTLNQNTESIAIAKLDKMPMIAKEHRKGVEK